MTAAAGNSITPPADADGPLKLGTRFGKFDIIKRIGRGGYASVYHAFDTILQRDVAIKVLHRVGGVSSDMLRRGVVEAQLMCQLHHKNIVKVYDANMTEGGLLYLVMELLVGRTLHQVLRHYERLAVEEACSIGIQIADAVEAAHQRGAIHRDLKPENVFITEDNVVKVLDFGIAKVVHGAKGNTTRPDAIQGTVLYMSPEQIAGHKLTGRCDIYALGNILFESLYGTHPCLLKNPDPDTLAVAWLQTYEIAPLLEEIAPYCPRHLSRVVSQAMAKRAEQRQASMKELKFALEGSLARYLKETNGGELQGRVRNLTGANEPEKEIGYTSHEVGKFPWYSKGLLAAPSDTEPHDGPPATTQTEVAVVETTVPVEPVKPVAPLVISERAAAVPVHSVLRAPRVASNDSAPPKAVKRRLGKTLMVAILVAAPLAGATLSIGLTRLYLSSKRAQATPSALVLKATPNPASPPVEPIDETIAPTATASPVATPSVSAAPPAVMSAAVPAVEKPKARPPAKPKKLDPSEARLRALEEQLNKGTLGVTPPR